MKRKKKIIIIIIVIILLLALGNLFSYLINKNKQYNSIDDFDSIKELVEYYGCKYKKTKNSSEEGYKKDIYLSFSEDPIDEEGNPNKDVYENIIKLVACKILDNYRIIDEDRNITARINIEEDKTVYYTINNMSNYFENLKSLYTINNKKEENISSINIVSKELQTIINNGLKEI